MTIGTFLIAMRLVTAASALENPGDLMRSHYKEGRWDEFFGLTTYVQETQKGTNEGERARLLEVLALMRHCQWAKAWAVLKTAAPGPQASALKTLLPLYATLPESAAPALVRDETELPRRWPVSKEVWLKLAPERLRRHVEPLCVPEVKP